MSAAPRRREPTIAYQVSRRTVRPAAQLLDDIAGLEVPGTHIVERGATYLVLAPRRPSRYTPGVAVTLAILISFAVLVSAAASVVLIALLPVALVPLAALLLVDGPRLAIGATRTDVGADTVITVSGDMWSALAVALHSYLAALPPAGGEPERPVGAPRRTSPPSGPAPVTRDDAADPSRSDAI